MQQHQSDSATMHSNVFYSEAMAPLLYQQHNHHQQDESFNFSQQQQQQQQPQENWSERILQDINGLLHILSPSGKILYCSESCIELIGYHPFELIGKLLTDFLHIDDLDIFSRNFQMAYNSLTRIKIHYRIRRKDNTYLLLESIGQPKQDIPDQPPQSFFAIAQPYLSRSNGLLDSFLELKMENEWLKKRLNDMMIIQQSSSTGATTNNSSMDDSAQYQQQYQQFQQQQLQQYFSTQQPQTQMISTSFDHNNNSQQQSYYLTTTASDNSPPLQTLSRRPSSCCSGSTMRQQTTNITDDLNKHYTMESSSVASSAEFNEMMVRYHNEEQTLIQQQDPTSSSSGAASYLSSNNSSTTTAITADILRKDKWKRRKKHRGVDDYVCADCGTTASPEWRKGPHGPKTLCNACGLRWAKKNKKI